METKKVIYKPYELNPRKISGRQMAKLEDTLREFGDLSGIIYNRKTKQFIGGNQRSKAIKIDDCEIKIIEELKKPDKQGTIAWGFVIWEENKYNWREVSWTKAKEKQANIIANKGGGEWDVDILKKHFDNESLIEWGFKQSELTWAKVEQQENLTSQSIVTRYEIMVELDSESDQEALFNKLQKEGYRCRVLTL